MPLAPAVRNALLHRLMQHLFGAVCMLIYATGASWAGTTGTWTPAAAGGTATAAGVTVTISGVGGNNSPPAAGTLNGTNFWTNPYGAAVSGAPALFIDPSPFGTGQSITITFSKAVDNPVLFVDRLGGVAGNGTAASSVWTLASSVATGGAPTLSLLGGSNSQFLLSGSTFQRLTPATASGGLCVAGDPTGTACGAVQINGTGITSVTFAITWAGTSNGNVGDGIQLALALPDTKVVIAKQSVGSTQTFPFTGTNGVANANLNTATTNPISSAASTVTDNTKAITVTETAVAGYTLTSTSCVDQKSTAITSSLAGSTLTIAPAAFNVAGQTITCTFVNTANSDMSISLAALPKTASIGVPYSGTFTCSNGAAPLVAATGATCAVSGLPAGLTTICAPVPPASVAPGASITCTVSGTPTTVGSSTVNGTTGATNDVNVANNTASTTISVTGADMTPDLSGLPATAMLGVAYNGTIKCTNNAAATASATNATCAVSGLPPGVTVGTCVPAPPATVAAGASISCPVSGTPTAVGSSTVTVTTGATNDTNGGTTAGGNNTATAPVTTSGSDMSISLAGLPAAASIGVPYSGTFTCSNGAAPLLAATAATCTVAGLPAGLTTSCAPTPPVTVAPGASITCTVSGTPTTVGSSTLTGTTGAGNDGNAANNSATASISVTGSDMTPDLSGLPTTATVGVAYAGTIKCTNNAAATASATNASCAVSGLPPGVTVGTCSPIPPATIAAGASISCPVTGTPTGPGSTTATVTTGATNDTNGGTGSGGNNSATASIATSASDMSISLAGLPPTASVGVPYSGTFTCSNGAAPLITATGATCAIAGLPAGLTTVCSPVPPVNVAPGATITCTVSGTPTSPGSSTLTGTTGASNDATPANNTATATLNVTGSDMAPDLSGLPATATVGTPYSGNVKCTNNASATASATNATCAVSGLPPGVTVGTCSPLPPATVAIGASISCPVSGTPTAAGTKTVTATTGATNDTNGGTGSGGNNTATASITTTSSDMSVDLSSLPMALNVGVPYSGTFTCSNGAAPLVAATNATCAVSGLPAGLSYSCAPTPPVSVAPGASITCTVSGTPTTPGSSTITGTTGASNDGNPANNTATATLGATGSDMAPDLSGLPATAVVGTPYSGTIKCTNSVSATASAISATCSVSGLPPGVTVGTCTPAPPATVAAGTSISCPVSGTPTAIGTTTVTATTGATNDVNGGTTAGGNNTATAPIATSGSDMAVNLGGLPGNGGVGQPYSGTYSCTNVGTLIATAASCSVGALPPGLTSTCSPTPPTSVAPGSAISCTVSGTPTATGTTTVTGTTGAGNDGNPANNVASTSIAIVPPALSVVKSTTTTSFAAAGTAITYSYAVTNSGTVTIFAPVTVTDSKIASVTCPSIGAGLPPGASITCSGNYMTTQADVDSGGVTNVAAGKSGTTTSPAVSVTVPSAPSTGLTLVKSSTTANFSAAGAVISYSYKVTNNGTITLTSAITVTDNKIATVSCPSIGAGLAPGASITCSASYTATQADVDAGKVVNVATASSGAVNSPASTATVPAVQSPALSVAKSTTTANFSAAGASIPYSYTVTNTGNVTVTSAISVADNKIASVSCPALPVGGLAPNASLVCTGTYTVTQTDVDAGSVTNIASAKTGSTTSPTTSVTVPASQAPALTIVKTSTSSSFAAPGATLSYSYKVTNSGNVTLTSAVAVADNKIASVSCPSIGSGLAPGASITCTATTTTTQADVDAGGITNTASAKSGSTTSPTTSLTVPANQSSALGLVKTANPTTYNAPGVAISYSYIVKNLGNVTIPASATLSIADNKIASVTCPAVPAGGLAPNATLTCSAMAVTTQANIDAGSIVNTATATTGTTTSPQVIATVTAVQSPALSIVKSTTTSSFTTTGTVVPYTFTVTNSGNTTLTQPVTVTDSRIASVTCPALPVGGLAPAASLTCTASYTTTQADLDTGGVTNTASAQSGPTTSPSTNHILTANQTHALVMTKSASPTTFAAPGVAIAYTYIVRNTGNTTLPSATVISVSDNKIASVSCPAVPATGLAPNATLTCTASATTTQADLDAGSITNIATATDGTAIAPSVSATVTGQQSPAMTMTKGTTATNFNTVGTVVPYTFKVTNTGNTTLTSAITVTDSKIAIVSCPPIGAGLVPGASLTCTGSYTTKQADLDAGSIINTASAKSGATSSTTDTHTLPAIAAPALSIAKTSTTTAFSTPGTSIPYSYKVTNTGNVTLTAAVSVADSRIASVTCPALPAAGLAPGAFITCAGSYTTTQADIDGGSVANTASAQSGSTTSPATTLTIPATQSPAMTVAKTSSTSAITTVGQSVPYSYKVTNSGNTTLTSAITITDNKIGSVSCPALPAAGLAPGANLTCSASYTVTQADLDAGGVTNTASAKSGPTTSPPVSLPIPATASPSLSIAKSSTAVSFTAAGASIPYSYTVTNTGNVTLTSAVTVADNKVASVTCPSIGAGLAPSASIVCTATYTTTQADVDAGGITNIASAKSGSTTSPPTSLTVTSTQTPALAIVKSTVATTYTTVGQSIPYTYKVTNSGNTTLTSAITVSDSKIASVTCPSIGSGLVPGGSITCTGSYSVTQADIDGGNILNTASAKSGLTTSPTVTFTLTGQQLPKLTIAKSSSTTVITTLGQIVPYSYSATNTGNVTLTTAVTLSDNKIAAVTCPSIGAGLAVGASITCTGSYTVAQADLDAGNVVNTATAASGTASGTITSNTTALTIPVTQSPGLSMVKSAPPAPYTTVGQVVPYSFAVTNSGNVTITSAITIADNKIPSVSCPALPVAGLAPGAGITCTGSYTVTQADLDGANVTNTATAKSGPTISSPPQMHSQPAGQTHALSLTKTPSAATYAAVGASVTYTYAVTNTGNVTIKAPAVISVSDNKIASVACPAVPAAGLVPAATLTCTASYTITQADLDAGSVINKATASDGTATSPQVSATITATQSPALSVVKTTIATSYATVGTVVPYTFAVTNTGNITLVTAITVADSKIASVSCPLIGSGLAPGSSITCTGGYTITQADIDAGSVTNIATAKSGPTSSPPGTHTLPAAQNRALTVAKSASPAAFSSTGTAITYSYVVTNSGNVTIPAASVISVSDNKLASVSCPAVPAAGLAPTKSITCTASYTTTQADIDAGSITNVASASDGVVTSPITSVTVPATQTPGLTVVKNTTATVYTTVGAVIPYTFVTTNTGNTTITAPIVMTDNKIATVACPSIGAGLAPGASITCTGSYTITQSDIDSGSVVNTAFAKSGPTTSTPPVTHILNGAQTSALTIVKSTATASFNAAGVAITYSYKVSNTGNVTLTSPVTVADNKISTVSCPALPVGGLIPAASITCAGTYTTTQADIDAGKVANTAAATSGTTVSPAVSIFVPATQSPALTIVKSTTSTTFSVVGSSIPYTYKVTNAGNTTLTTAITVTDNKIAAVSCPALPAAGLAPGGSVICTGTYSVAQADIDAGKVINTASAASGVVTSPQVSVTVNATQNPALSIIKSSTTTTYAAAGVTIPYSYKVTNSGNTTLTTAITVADNKIASVSCPSVGAGLAPGASITCTGSYTTVQADVDAGAVTNTASAKSGAVASPNTSLTITGAQTPALSLVKTSTTLIYTTLGVTIPYSYKVTNSGNTTITTPVTIADNKIASVACPALPVGGLAPLASITCTASYITTQADVDAGKVTNVATAASGPVVSAPATLVINSTLTPSLGLVKSTTATSFNATGTALLYSYKVTNTGNTTISTPVTVADNKIASVTCPALPVGGLTPGSTIVCSATYLTVQSDLDAGAVTNIATAKSGALTSPTATVTVPAAQAPALGIVKSSTVANFSAVGAILPYSYKVTNTGNVTLTTAITVSDNKIASVSCPALPVGGLLPAASIICTGAYTTTQADLDSGSVLNTASAKSGAVTSPSVSLVIIAAQTPALTIVKSSTITSFNAPGIAVPYSYKVTNSGNTTLTLPVSVVDNKIASVTCPTLPPAGLIPNAFVTCTGSYTTTQADVDAGKVTNTAFAKSGVLSSGTVTLTINGTQSPAIGIVKSTTATAFTAAGNQLAYSYKVTNTGNTTLTAPITVSDNKIASVACPALPVGGLPPATFITCTGTYTVTLADLNAGSVTNTASASSGAIVSGVVSLTVTGTQKPDFTIKKTAVTPVAINNGDGTFTATFQVVLLNTGNVDLVNVQMTDDYGSQLPAGASVKSASIKSMASSVRGPLATANPAYTATSAVPTLVTGTGESLAVGEAITSIFDIKFDPGSSPSGTQFGNTVIAKTIFGAGTSVAVSASRSAIAGLPFVANAPLTVTKSTPKSDITRGELVPYTIAVKNTGSVARSGLTLVDQMPSGFKYRVGSATIDGVAREPIINGNVLSWPNVTVATTRPLTLKLILIAGAGIGAGEFTNQAWVASATGTVLSNIGTATVRMTGDPTFDCTDIIGKVFDDTDKSGYADDGKRGIANVRLATARGQLVTTDSEGRYHIACADIPASDRGTSFILKLDERTLPTGYRVTTENPRVIRITAGKMSKINFGASIGRVARLDLTAAAFEAGTTRLRAKWQDNLGQVLAALKQERSILRLTYRQDGKENAALAQDRINALSAVFRDTWKHDGETYPLTIETEVVMDVVPAR